MKTLLKKVKSSNIHSIGYDEALNVLYVEFNSHALYSYSPVKPKTFDHFKKADSKGKFFHKYIKDGPFEVQRIL